MFKNISLNKSIVMHHTYVGIAFIAGATLSLFDGTFVAILMSIAYLSALYFMFVNSKEKHDEMSQIHLDQAQSRAWALLILTIAILVSVFATLELYPSSGLYSIIHTMDVFKLNHFLFGTLFGLGHLFVGICYIKLEKDGN